MILYLAVLYILIQVLFYLKWEQRQYLTAITQKKDS